jgi:GDP-L-fucose synthase
MKIFVTGATGFLGSHLMRFLRSKGHDVTGVGSAQCDLRKIENLQAFSSTRWDQIYHLAAWTQAGDFCLRHPGEQWIINQEMNTSVLRWWHEEQPQAKMIAIGTSCCYEPGTPHIEDRFLSGMPIDSLFTYAMTKRMLLAGLQALSKQFGLRYLFVVPSTLYGADYHLDGRQMHFIFDLLRKIVDGKRHGTPVTLWGDGSQRRELIHVRSFIEGMYELAGSIDNDIFNIGGGEEYPIRWYAETLCDMIGYDHAQIEYDLSRYVGARSKVLSIEKIRGALPKWKPIPLREGLEEIVQWYLSSTHASVASAPPAAHTVCSTPA